MLKFFHPLFVLRDKKRLKSKFSFSTIEKNISFLYEERT